MSEDFSEVRLIRPAAIVPEQNAIVIVKALEQDSVHRGGLWSATPSVWERYDRPWTTFVGSIDAMLIGTLSVVYDHPRRHEITIYRASLTDVGIAEGWTVDSLCDEPLGYAGLTLASCPRADMPAPPRRDPFKARAREAAAALAASVPGPRDRRDFRSYLSA